MQLNKYIDHTLLKASATKNDILKICDEAIQYQFYAVCVNGSYVSLVKEYLKETDIKVAAVIGFPLGSMDTETKKQEAKNCIDNGADEIDMVINIGHLKSGYYESVMKEITEIKNIVGSKVLKVILETCFLTKEEIIIASQIAINSKADFVKTSTGFGTAGATIEDVELMKEVVCDLAMIKASGGIKDRETAIKFINAGASRLGTSSGVAIVTNKLINKTEY
jgi:deoxyribose-phosphate aldolase